MYGSRHARVVQYGNGAVYERLYGHVHHGAAEDVPVEGLAAREEGEAGAAGKCGTTSGIQIKAGYRLIVFAAVLAAKAFFISCAFLCG